MRVKSFRGDSSASVMALIKAEFGPAAVILSTQAVREGDRQLTEITAALDTPAGASIAPMNSGASGAIPAPRLSGADVPGQQATMSGDSLLRMQREWNELREHLLGFMTSRMDLGQLTPRQRQSVEYLEREGVDSAALLTLWRSLKEDPQASVLGLLSELTPVLPWSHKNWPQRVHVFMGPHGAGKTSCAIRMALKRRRSAPKAEICLVNADPGRSKDRGVLRHYAELSRMTYREISTARDGEKLLADLDAYDRVFIDPPALPPAARATDFLTELGLLARPGELAAHLTLSPHYDSRQLKRFAEQYGPGEGSSALPASIVWTKIDEAGTFGGVINAGHHCGLPISALSFGSGLRDSLVPAESLLVWRLIFKHELPQPTKTSAPRAA